MAPSMVPPYSTKAVHNHASAHPNPLLTGLSLLPAELHLNIYKHLPVDIVSALKHCDTHPGAVVRENFKTLHFAAHKKYAHTKPYYSLWHGKCTDHNLPHPTADLSVMRASRGDRQIRALERWDSAAKEVVELLQTMLWPTGSSNCVAPDDESLLEMVLMLMPVTVALKPTAEDALRDDLRGLAPFYADISRLPVGLRCTILDCLMATSQAVLRSWEAMPHDIILASWWWHKDMQEFKASGLMAFALLPGIISILADIFRLHRQSSLKNVGSAKTGNPLLYLATTTREKLAQYVTNVVLMQTRVGTGRRIFQWNNFNVEVIGAKETGLVFVGPCDITGHDPENDGFHYHLTKLTDALLMGPEFDDEAYATTTWPTRLMGSVLTKPRQRGCCWDWELADIFTAELIPCLTADGNLGLADLFTGKGYKDVELRILDLRSTLQQMREQCAEMNDKELRVVDRATKKVFAEGLARARKLARVVGVSDAEYYDIVVSAGLEKVVKGKRVPSPRG
ncbi:hypothetical protein LTR08_001366 [Meristemomyces frigidus]|nr:hypothetical protein LTR08_001366 [Meristemomyces frigidus]